MAEYRCLANYPSLSTTSGPRTNGVEFYVTSDAWLTVIWGWRPTTSVVMPTSAALYRVSDGAELVVATRSAVAADATGWIPFYPAAPYKLTPTVRCRAGVLFPGSTVPGTTNYWAGSGGGAAGLTSGPLVMPNAANATGNKQGSYTSGVGAVRTFPNTASAQNTIYGVDVTVSDVDPTAPVEPAWAPNPAIAGTVTWAADTTKADAPAAGYSASGSQRQNGAGQFNDPTVPWPPLYVPAPFGRPGSRALPLRVPDNYRRYEVVPHPSLTFADGDQAWFGAALAVGADTDVEQTDYQVLWQLHGSGPGGSPSVALEASGGRWRLTGGANRPNPQTLAYDTGQTYAYVRDLSTDLVKDRWEHFVIYVGFWSAINSGRVDVWRNGTKVLDNFRPPCGTNYPKIDAQDTGRAYLKTGLYHREAIRGGTTWIAEQATGTGYGAVDPTRPLRTVRALDLAAI